MPVDTDEKLTQINDGVRWMKLWVCYFCWCRPVDAVQADWAPRATRGTRQQRQQQMDQFVMPADLGAMLQDMYRTGTGVCSSDTSVTCAN